MIGITQIVFSFGVFSSGYLARPIGGVIFGYNGDKYGRKNATLYSILIIGITTSLMAIVPNYNTLGVIAPIVFILLRITQGLALGGELPIALVFYYEHTKKPGLATGMIIAFVLSGVLLASLIKLVINSMSIVPTAFEWRLGFIFGGILSVIIFFLRKKLKETPDFLLLNVVTKSNYISSYIEQLRNMTKGFFIIGAHAAVVSIMLLYIPTLLSLTQEYSKIEIAYINFIGVFTLVLSTFIAGYLADKYGTKKIYTIGLLLTLILAPICYSSFIDHSKHATFIYLITVISSGMLAGSATANVLSIFPTYIRCSSIATSFNMAFAIIGGLSPLLISYILKIKEINSPILLIIIMLIIGSGLIGIIIKPKNTI